MFVVGFLASVFAVVRLVGQYSGTRFTAEWNGLIEWSTEPEWSATTKSIACTTNWTIIESTGKSAIPDTCADSVSPETWTIVSKSVFETIWSTVLTCRSSWTNEYTISCAIT